MALLIRLFMLSYHSYELSDKVALLNKAFMAWSKHLICGIRLYMIFSCLLISVDLIWS
jgi:hypothetical protein